MRLSFLPAFCVFASTLGAQVSNPRGPRECDTAPRLKPIAFDQTTRTIQPASPSAIWTVWCRGRIEKGEYETTAEFEARRQAALLPDSLYWAIRLPLGGRDECGHQIVYVADEGNLVLDTKSQPRDQYANGPLLGLACSRQDTVFRNQSVGSRQRDLTLTSVRHVGLAVHGPSTFMVSKAPSVAVPRAEAATRKARLAAAVVFHPTLNWGLNEGTEVASAGYRIDDPASPDYSRPAAAHVFLRVYADRGWFVLFDSQSGEVLAMKPLSPSP